MFIRSRSTYIRSVFTALFCVISQVPAFSAANVLTQHNDLARTGQNTSETILTPALVSSGAFGKLFTLPVDGQVYAQPLYMSSLNIGGTLHNVVFIETEHDSIYAFDADLGGTPLWHVTLLDAAHGAAPGATPVSYLDSNCINIYPEYGITGTPVIDPTTNTMYVVGVTYENSYAKYRIHALDVTTGNEKFGGPNVIQPSVAASGEGSSNGVLNFDPKWELQRPGLALVNGQVYVGFGSHCDQGSWHGWLVAFNASTLAQTSVFVPTPNGSAGAFWNSGAAPASDVVNGTPRLFVVTGNGDYDATYPFGTNNMDYSDDIIRLNIANGLQVADEFTPMNQQQREADDQDLGSGGSVILPDQPGANPHLMAQLGKEQTIYLVNRDNLGGYDPDADDVVQEVQINGNGLWGNLAYWNGYVYAAPSEGFLSQYAISNGLLSLQATASQPIHWEGATPSISSNGATNGILWLVNIDNSFINDPLPNQESLLAYDATNVGKLLYSSTNNVTRDTTGSGIAFPVPTVANGKVYVGASNQVSVYGLFGQQFDFVLSPSASSINIQSGSSASDYIDVTGLNGFNGSISFSTANLPPGVTATFTEISLNSFTVSFVASSGAVTGNFPVTIAGTSGSITHSITVNVVVAGQSANPLFSIAAATAGTGIWGPDTDYSGGSGSYTNAYINTAGVPNAAPESVYQAERWGTFTYNIPNFTPGASYIVNLHFAEIYFNAPGKRLFNVLINGTTVLSNFDIFAAAGGADTAVVESFNAVANSSGNIVIQFLPGAADQPKISAIQILAAGSGSGGAAGVAIDSGGSATGSWLADTDYSGGQTGYTSAYIDTSRVANPAPESVYQSERYGDFTYSVPNLTPGASYVLNLHFAEIYWPAAGERLFNVFINGNQVLNNFDIFAAAGGKDIAIVKSFTATANGSGIITVQFTSGAADYPKVSGIELAPGSVSSPKQVEAIRAGGPALGTWLNDTYFSGGATAYTTAAINTSGVANPAPQSVYQAERYGDFTYTIPNLTPGASYIVNLHFAEIYWSAPGERLFNVLINGVAALVNFDIVAAAGGPNIAVVESFKAFASNSGTITLQFTTGAADLPKISGIEILEGAQVAPTEVLAINVAGYATGSWTNDTHFSGGQTAYVTNSINTGALLNPAPQVVYQTERYGTFSYDIPNLTPLGAYTVNLHFAEIYWSFPGERMFNVSINGAQVLNNFDIVAAAGGPETAVVTSFPVNADGGGNISIQFTPGAADLPKVSGIQIMQ